MSNQLSSICYQYIESFCWSAEDHTDHFWSKLLTDVVQQRAPYDPGLEELSVIAQILQGHAIESEDLLTVAL